MCTLYSTCMCIIIVMNYNEHCSGILITDCVVNNSLSHTHTQTLDHSNDKIVTLENDHSQLNTRLEHAETLKREVELLSRELQVLGDLYQQQKERTNTLLSHTSSELEATTLCTALVRERDIAEARSVGVRQEVGVLSARVRELEALLERRDNEGSLLRGQLERTEGQWGVKIKVNIMGQGGCGVGEFTSFTSCIVESLCI